MHRDTSGLVCQGRLLEGWERGFVPATSMGQGMDFQDRSLNQVPAGKTLQPCQPHSC